jgi:hypothetical protein
MENSPGVGIILWDHLYRAAQYAVFWEGRL